MRPEDLTDNIDEALIDHEVSLLTRGQIDIAWRSLCAHMIYAAVASFRVKVVNKYCVENRIAARRWMEGGGVISFEEACETAGLCGDRIQSLLDAEKRTILTINSERSTTNARSSCRSDQDLGGLVAVDSAFAEGGGSAAGSAAGFGGGRCHGFPGVQD